MSRITIDPITRIEGHLRIDCEVDPARKVTAAWASGTMWRGVEQILLGRDPRDAWAITQRFCGVCTTVHAIASVRAVENALGMPVPKNAQYIRNMMIAAHAVHDAIVQFYHLSALDWVDGTAAAQADPAKTAALAEGLSDWPMNGRQVMQATKDRLNALVGSGQLGIFANGYWGHAAMKLPPEVDLLAVAHYLQALEVQRKANKIVTILGGKTPHVQNIAVGGVANPIALDSPSALSIERLLAVKEAIDELKRFVQQVYNVDVAAVAALYPEWTKLGKGVTHYLSCPEYPLDEKGTRFETPGGYIEDGRLESFKPIATFGDALLGLNVAESVKHSWYQGGKGPLHPYKGQTVAEYTGFVETAKYSFVKSPTFRDRPAQVGPLARVLAAVAAGHEATVGHLNRVLATIEAVGKSKLPLEALHSTLGRIAARSVMCAMNVDVLERQWKLLMDNIASGDARTYEKPVFPKGEMSGFGFHEAPRGILSHWVVIKDGVIENYQAVVPTTWNAAPRNEQDQPGPYEASLVGTPLADPERPLEVLRTIHSFDPCLACAVHLVDTTRRDVVQVRVR
ncbi:MAG: nickel-dependent hydrogenase large subunit [Deltaproteobacteria bacterium]|nr:nickel-dependent hydrogenase large subunit [Deltaproteobacteria bacterium]